MSAQSTVQSRPCLAPTVGHCSAGEYPQSLAVPQAVAAMGTQPDSQGYYTSTYDGRRYARATVLQGAMGQFADGTPVQQGATHYFLVEPIEWWLVPYGGGCHLMLSRRVLTATPFAQADNAWQSSSVRAFLQQWVVGVFSPQQQRRIVDIPLDNDSVGLQACYGGKTVRLDADTMPWCRQSPTYDGVFLLSKAEYDCVRSGGIAAPCATDYALAMGTYVNWDGTALGWLRSAECCADRAFIFGVEDEQSALLGLSSGRRVDAVMGVLPVVCVRQSA